MKTGHNFVWRITADPANPTQWSVHLVKSYCIVYHSLHTRFVPAICAARVVVMLYTPARGFMGEGQQVIIYFHQVTQLRKGVIYVCLSACLSVCLFICLSFFLSFYFSFSTRIYRVREKGRECLVCLPACQQALSHSPYPGKDARAFEVEPFWKFLWCDKQLFWRHCTNIITVLYNLIYNIAQMG